MRAHVGAVAQRPVRSVPASTRKHWKVTPLSRLAENPNVAVVSTVILSGAESMGDLEVTVLDRPGVVAGVGSGLPESRVARTSKV